MDIWSFDGQSVRSLWASNNGMMRLINFMFDLARSASPGSQIIGPGFGMNVGRGDWMPTPNYYTPLPQYDNQSLAQVHSGHIHYGW